MDSSYIPLNVEKENNVTTLHRRDFNLTSEKCGLSKRGLHHFIGGMPLIQRELSWSFLYRQIHLVHAHVNPKIHLLFHLSSWVDLKTSFTGKSERKRKRENVGGHPFRVSERWMVYQKKNLNKNVKSNKNLAKLLTQIETAAQYRPIWELYKYISRPRGRRVFWE